ncbi:MAG: hypothetical protein P4L80_12995 [Xanthobacteraceae bacterium]|nr:hypothetical protein [Xanthobacteraceae bacterium]
MKRCKLLHIRNDRNSSDAVADALGSIADVVLVDSIEDAREAMIAINFDLVLLDTTFLTEPNFDPRSDFRNRQGKVVQAIAYSALSDTSGSRWHLQISFATTWRRDDSGHEQPRGALESAVGRER